MIYYEYGMRERGFSPGCQPMDGFIRREDSWTHLYYDLLVYDRKLSGNEVYNYSLDYIDKFEEDAR